MHRLEHLREAVERDSIELQRLQELERDGIHTLNRDEKAMLIKLNFEFSPTTKLAKLRPMYCLEKKYAQFS